MSQSRRSVLPAVQSTAAPRVEGPPGFPYAADPIPFSTPSIETSHEIRSESTANRSTWNAFSHYRKTCSLPTQPVAIKSSSSPEWWINRDGARWYANYAFPTIAVPSSFGPLDQPDFGLDSMYSLIDGELFINPPTDLEDNLQTALKRVLPGIRPNLSILNSIYELKDMRTLAHTATSIGDTLRRCFNAKHPKTGLTMGQMYGKMSLKEANRRVSSEYLQFKFNLAPLYADILGVMKSLGDYKKQARRLLSQSDRVNRRHVVIDVFNGAFDPNVGDVRHAYDVSEGKLPYPYYLFIKSYRQVEYEPVKLHVEIEYSYTISEFKRRHADSLALMDSLGLCMDPSILWNAAPWSFAIDWVAGIGQFLGRLKVPGLQPVLNIRRALWSVKRTRHLRMSFDANSQTGIPSTRVTEVAYRRQPFMPQMSWIESSGLSRTEVSLGYALVSTRGRSLRR